MIYVILAGTIIWGQREPCINDNKRVFNTFWTCKNSALNLDSYEFHIKEISFSAIPQGRESSRTWASTSDTVYPDDSFFEVVKLYLTPLQQIARSRTTLAKLYPSNSFFRSVKLYLPVLLWRESSRIFATTS